MTDAITIKVPEQTGYEAERNALVARANTLVVTTQPEFEAATAFMQEGKRLADAISGVFDPVVKAAHAAHKAATAARKEFLLPVETAMDCVRKQMNGFLDREREEARRLAAEQQRIARETAEKAALEAAMAREAEAHLAAAEKAAAEKAGNEEAARAAAAREAEARAAAEAAVENVAVPIVTVAPVQKTEGVAVREVWDFEILSPNAIPREYLMVDEKKILAVVRAMKSETKIPGVRAFAKAQAAIR